MKKSKGFQNPKNDDQKLYEMLKGEISDIKKSFKILYFGSKDGEENLIHGLVRRIDRIKEILSDRLFDGESFKTIVENKGIVKHL